MSIIVWAFFWLANVAVGTFNGYAQKEK